MLMNLRPRVGTRRERRIQRARFADPRHLRQHISLYLHPNPHFTRRHKTRRLPALESVSKGIVDISSKLTRNFFTTFRISIAGSNRTVHVTSDPWSLVCHHGYPPSPLRHVPLSERGVREQARRQKSVACVGPIRVRSSAHC